MLVLIHRMRVDSRDKVGVECGLVSDFHGKHARKAKKYSYRPTRSSVEVWLDGGERAIRIRLVNNLVLASKEK